MTANWVTHIFHNNTFIRYCDLVVFYYCWNCSFSRRDDIAMVIGMVFILVLTATVVVLKVPFTSTNIMFTFTLIFPIFVKKNLCPNSYKYHLLLLFSHLSSISKDRFVNYFMPNIILFIIIIIITHHHSLWSSSSKPPPTPAS